MLGRSGLLAASEGGYRRVIRYSRRVTTTQADELDEIYPFRRSSMMFLCLIGLPRHSVDTVLTILVALNSYTFIVIVILGML